MAAMAETPNPSAGQIDPPLRRRIALASGVGLAGFAALLFVPAGRLDWTAGWLYLAIVTANLALNYVQVRRRNPELIRHRMRFGKGIKTWDKIWAGLITPVFLSVYVVAGLDAGRHGWSDMPLWLWPVGLAMFLPGTALLTWSMAVNPFFETAVRIQKERGHRVIDSGPYRLVRHPGYLGFSGWILAAPLLLGSWWAGIPSVLALAGFVVRTALEDRTLRAELPGYADYARRVRYRLIPGIW